MNGIDPRGNGRQATSVTVLHVITGLNDGGAEAALFRLVCFDRAHCHHVVSMMDLGKYGPALRERGISVDCLEMQPGRADFASFRKLVRLIRRVRPDVVQTWMYHADLLGGMAARVAGVHAVSWGIRHSNLTPGTVKRSTIWVARACAVLSKWIPARIVSCSAQAAVAHRRIGYASRKLSVIPNGYDLVRFGHDEAARAALRTEWGADDAFVIGMVARYDPQKDHDNLIGALSRLVGAGHRILCVLVGTGMDRDNASLMAALDAIGVADKVLLLGRRADIPQVMSALDLHVLSSLGEAFPNVLAEAMACGTPCVTTDVGDAALIVGDCGWVVPPRDSVALASAIADAMSAAGDRDAWSARRARARKHIESTFTIERMAESYASVWEAARGE
jgi:glycosyltransferase involved in cell wall biosynthesis